MLVELAADAGALGARLLGGGFGGAVLVLAHISNAEQIGDAIEAGYRRRTGAGGGAVLVCACAARPAAGPASAAGAGRPARARTRTGRAGISAAKEKVDR